MINPSIYGWIDKFFEEQNYSLKIIPKTNVDFYEKVRETGFIYGHITNLDTPVEIDSKKLFKEEICKLTLLNTLYLVYCKTTLDLDTDKFIKKTIDFYNKISPEQPSFFKKWLPKNTSSVELEDLINKRTQINNNIISKNFLPWMANAFLFIDVLAFHHYLTQNTISEKYFKKIEDKIVTITILALEIKTHKTQYDNQLIKFFESSVRYTKFYPATTKKIENLLITPLKNELEKYYLIDIANIVLWNENKENLKQIDFLNLLSYKFSISKEFIEKSNKNVNIFISKHKKEIPSFNQSSPVKQFYNKTTQNVANLIERNKNRLIKEITASKQLMILLAESTHRDLSDKEKKKVKKQLLEICKTIPSLTIFMLPGGSFLLPILVKIIPQLLPSTFNENLKKED